MSTLYKLFIDVITGGSGDYTVFNALYAEYLDQAIAQLSRIAKKPVFEETKTITSQDITNGFFDLSFGIVKICYSTLGGLDTAYQASGDGRIDIIDPSVVKAGTYKFTYEREYKKFSGVDHDDSYFDYPKSVELGLLFYALGVYQATNNIIKTDGMTNFIRSVQEDGLSRTFGIAGQGEDNLSPEKLKAIGVGYMRKIPNARPLIFSVRA